MRTSRLGGVSNQIPTLYAYFQEDDQFYLVQEWVSTYKQATSSLLTKPQVGETSLPLTNKNSQIASSESAIINSANLPNYFHFIADSTFPNLQTAVEQIKTLQVAGYRQPGVFWIPDYPNLSDQRSFVVYAATFSDLY